MGENRPMLILPELANTPSPLRNIGPNGVTYLIGSHYLANVCKKISANAFFGTRGRHLFAVLFKFSRCSIN